MAVLGGSYSHEYSQAGAKNGRGERRQPTSGAGRRLSAILADRPRDLCEAVASLTRAHTAAEAAGAQRTLCCRTPHDALRFGVLLAVGEELGAEVAGVVRDVRQDDDGFVSRAVEAEVGGVAAGLPGVMGDGLTGLPGRDL